MLEVSHVEGGKQVLLVGEGNFSFTISLLTKIADTTKSPSRAKIIASCFQNYRKLSNTTKENARLACNLGAEVWFGIDATSLHQHERFENEKFDFIVFNFPHVGGKMKLHLNRLLLKNFFVSASLLLSVNGKILVTLCRGQSGTPYDTNKRKKGDTWQIIDMASHGDLILVEAHPFCSSNWPLYNSNGYRSLEKGFQLDEAITFTFVRSPLRIECKEIMDQEDFTCLHCPYIQEHLDKLQNHIFEEARLFSHYMEETSAVRVCNTLQTICLCRHPESTKWWEILHTEKKDYDLSCLLVCYPCWAENPKAPHRVILMNFTTDSDASLLSFLHRLCVRREEKGNSSSVTITHYQETFNAQEIATVFFRNDSHDKPITVAVYIDPFFQLDTNVVKSWPKLSLLLESCSASRSRHPPAYCHDICFWIPDTFSTKCFACALLTVAGQIIKNFRLIDEYFCPIKKQKSLCYRIIYQSLSAALSSEKAFYLQTKVIGPFLEACLGIIVR
ncbi:uncharacterized protein LOC132088367 [Daphnia carinata]|uniref:uncharacterized protein LOC132088367 n=1 Tax=Daphnia carinata TaxID=120202 RepID=UPI0028692C21|nr:uncharacterized protein LOC132088367 [Daphnia carinata]XP_059353100.1 uncharacterized protein LOC132088367 [Daphnia carinata]